MIDNSLIIKQSLEQQIFQANLLDRACVQSNQNEFKINSAKIEKTTNGIISFVHDCVTNWNGICSCLERWKKQTQEQQAQIIQQQPFVTPSSSQPK